jgi:hypothetical protein
MVCLICGHKRQPTKRGRKPPGLGRICSRLCLQRALAELGRNVEVDEPTDDDRHQQMAARSRELTEGILAWRPHHG